MQSKIAQTNKYQIFTAIRLITKTYSFYTQKITQKKLEKA